MAKERIPNFKKMPEREFIFPYLLLVLHQLGGSARRKDVIKHLAEVFNLSDELRTKKRGKDFLFHSEVSWVKEIFIHTRYLEPYSPSSHGFWTLSQKAKEKISDLIDREQDKLEEFRKEVDLFWKEEEALFKSKTSTRKKRKAKKRETGKEDLIADRETMQDEIAKAVDEELRIEEEEQKTKEQQLETIRQMKPERFERLCSNIFQAMGYEDVYVTQKTKDGGIDGLGFLAFGLVRFKVVFEAKRWKEDRKINIAKVRELQGSMDQLNANRGVIITTSDFTKDAKTAADELAIGCVNGERLIEILKEHELGYSKKEVTTEYESNEKIVTTEYEFDEDFFDKV